MAMEWVSLESQNAINIPPPSVKDAPCVVAGAALTSQWSELFFI